MAVLLLVRAFAAYCVKIRGRMSQWAVEYVHESYMNGRVGSGGANGMGLEIGHYRKSDEKKRNKRKNQKKRGEKIKKTCKSVDNSKFNFIFAKNNTINSIKNNAL